MPGVETLTGFKWIGRVPRLRYGYEEAIGYCVDPANVPDKDGISAAAADRRNGRRAASPGPDSCSTSSTTSPARTGSTRRMHSRCAWRTSRSSACSWRASVRRRRPRSAACRWSRSTTSPRRRPGIPPTDGLRYLLADATRVIIRPSGTEPKLKVYLEAIVHPNGSLAEARAEAARRLARTKAAMEGLTAT